MDDEKKPITHVRITDLGIAYVEWEDSRPPRTGDIKDLEYYGEMAAFSSGWLACEAAMKRKEER